MTVDGWSRVENSPTPTKTFKQLRPMSTNTSTAKTTLLDDSLHNQAPTEVDTESDQGVESENKFEDANLETLFLSPQAVIEKTRQPWKNAREEITEVSGIPRWTGSINVDTLDLFIRHIQKSVTETKLLVTKEGLYTRVTNPANVQLFEVWIDKSDFESYDVESEGVLGIGWTKNVKTMINQVSSGEVIDIKTHIETEGSPAPDLSFEFEDEFQIPEGVDLSTLEMSASKISGKLDGSNRAKFEIDDGFVMRTSTISPTSLRSIPDLPEMDHTSRITLPGLDLKEFLSRADTIGRFFSLLSDPEGSVVFNSEGDTASVTKEFEGVEDLMEYVEGARNDNLELSTYAQKVDESTYSIEFAKDTLSGIRKTQLRESYRIDFGDEQPMAMERSLGNESFIKTIIAPRISNN